MATQRNENPQAVGLDGVNIVRQEMELLRDKIASFYVTIDSARFPIVEAEVGDVLHAIRQACKRMRKAQATLAQEALPGMREMDG